MKTEAVRVLSYPIGRAAEQYRDVVKPVLAPVAKRLGFSVGPYRGHGNPSTTLRCIDASSKVDCVVVYWNGLEVEVGVRSRVWRDEMKTERGQIVNAMTFGVHDAYGRSNAADLAKRIEDAIANALAEFNKPKKESK